MSSRARSQQRQNSRDELVSRWGQEHDVNVERLDDGQKWLVFVALQLLSWFGNVTALKRLLGCLLSHSGMGLSSTLIGKLIGCSDRNVRHTRGQPAAELWRRVSNPERGRPAAKLGPENVGRLANFLVHHPGAKVAEILAFLAEELEVEIGPMTLRRYIKRYGLGCLREGVHEQGPLFWAQAATEAPSS